MAIDRCACCGAYIPEGRQVCANCEQDWDVTKDNSKNNHKKDEKGETKAK